MARWTPTGMKPIVLASTSAPWSTACGGIPCVMSMICASGAIRFITPWHVPTKSSLSPKSLRNVMNTRGAYRASGGLELLVPRAPRPRRTSSGGRAALAARRTAPAARPDAHERRRSLERQRPADERSAASPRPRPHSLGRLRHARSIDAGPAGHARAWRRASRPRRSGSGRRFAGELEELRASRAGAARASPR